MSKKKNKNHCLKGTQCTCGYFNKEENVKRYGSCRGCGKTIDPKAKFEYEMYCMLRLWRKNK